MSKTLKQLCDAAREELGWDVPATYSSSIDPDGKQTFRLANRQGFSMSQESVIWQELKTEKAITLIAATQSYALPSDYRYMVPGTEWDQNSDRRVLGPLHPRLWAEEEHSGVVFGLNWRYEIRGGNVVLQQTVAAGDADTIISYEYVSSYWARSSVSAAKLEFTTDTDTQVFDDDVFVDGLIWRLKKAKGFPFEVEYSEYRRRLNTLIGRDGGAKDTYFVEGIDLDGVNIPETGFGS